jgi:hypothetical protein
MSGIFFHNADGAVYSQYLDDTVWQMVANEPLRGYWNGAAWVDTSGYPHFMTLIVKTGATWQEGFRPTTLRITGTIGAQGTGVLLQDSAYNLLGETNTAPVATIDITWLGFDIFRFQMYGYTLVTNIEFLGG